MYSNLTLYYLNQMGINPWIKKETYSNIVNRSVINSINSSIKLVVFISSNQSDKARILFKRMMSFINVGMEELLIINVDSSVIGDRHSQEWKEQLKNKKPLATLVLGVNTIDLSGLNFGCPVISGMEPDFLLKQPKEKKNIFKVLNYIKDLINA